MFGDGRIAAAGEKPAFPYISEQATFLGLVEAQENGMGRWQLRTEHEKQSLARDVLWIEDQFTLVAFRRQTGMC